MGIADMIGLYDPATALLFGVAAGGFFGYLFFRLVLASAPRQSVVPATRHLLLVDREYEQQLIYTCPACGKASDVGVRTVWVGEDPLYVPAGDVKCPHCLR
jgi:hypothetical protein